MKIEKDDQLEDAIATVEDGKYFKSHYVKDEARFPLYNRASAVGCEDPGVSIYAALSDAQIYTEGVTSQNFTSRLSNHNPCCACYAAFRLLRVGRYQRCAPRRGARPEQNLFTADDRPFVSVQSHGYPMDGRHPFINLMSVTGSSGTADGACSLDVYVRRAYTLDEKSCVQRGYRFDDDRYIAMTLDVELRRVRHVATEGQDHWYSFCPGLNEIYGKPKPYDLPDNSFTLPLSCSVR